MAELIAKQEEKKRKINIDDDSPFYVDIRTSLNDTGSGFCLAKWTQVTMHLQLGHTHSCHHPKTHQIPLRELKRNPTALHNTMYKKRRRKEMLEGQRPEECDYCWNVEDSSNRFSDRTFKSAENWSYPYMDEIKQLGWRDDYNPKYVEVSFSNTCNFKCSYCGPAFSTKWMEESEKYGAYPTTDAFNDLTYLKQEGKMPMPVTKANPYVDAFWNWWPNLYEDLHTFRITGGEPLMSQDTWKVLDYIIEHPNPNKKLNLAINSNLGVPDKLVDRFIEKVSKICEQDRVKEFVIFTSVDSWGAQAEYIRNGLVFNIDTSKSSSYAGLGNTIYDLSGAGNTGAVINGPVFSGLNGGSLVFDGIEEYIDVPSISTITGDFTIGGASGYQFPGSAGTSSQIRGVYRPASGDGDAALETTLIASTGNSTAFGDLNTGRRVYGALSDSHGGLG